VWKPEEWFECNLTGSSFGRTSNLVRKTGNQYQIVFEKLELQVSENLISSQKNKGDRPTEKLWVDALDRTMVRWLEEGQPQKGVRFSKMMAKSFEDMGSEAPAIADISKWLRMNVSRLWGKAKGE